MKFLKSAIAAGVLTVMAASPVLAQSASLARASAISQGENELDDGTKTAVIAGLAVLAVGGIILLVTQDDDDDLDPASP